jgi:hypothetical protein
VSDALGHIFLLMPVGQDSPHVRIYVNHDTEPDLIVVAVD